MPVGGSFQGAGNWTGQFVPDGTQDVAFFDVPGTYTVQLDQNVTHHGMRANGAGVNVTLDLNDHDYIAGRDQHRRPGRRQRLADVRGLRRPRRQRRFHRRGRTARPRPPRTPGLPSPACGPNSC